jgi:hypothetical protein
MVSYQHQASGLKAERKEINAQVKPRKVRSWAELEAEGMEVIKNPVNTLLPDQSRGTCVGRLLNSSEAPAFRFLENTWL